MKMMTDIQNGIVYKSSTGAIELQKDIKSDTVWASQKQIADIFGVAIPTINEHVRNIYKIDELKKDSTIRKFRIVQKEGGRSVNRSVDHYNLDMILSVGYRVNSKTATKFRQWATQTLRQHITDGFTINPARIKNNYDQFLNAIDEVKLQLFLQWYNFEKRHNGLDMNGLTPIQKINFLKSKNVNLTLQCNGT